MLVSSHLLSDLERVIGHVMFLREGRLQLFVECDGAIEHLRCLPSRERPTPRRVGALHWAGGALRVDALWHPEAQGAPALGVEDLLEQLNS